jgi:hypothetical protein
MSMRFLTVDQAQSEPFSTEYRYRIWTTLVAFLVCVAIVIASVFGALSARAEGAWIGVFILGWIAFWFLFFAWMLSMVLRARLRPTNWLVRTQSAGVLIKFRTPLNYHFEPETLAAVHLDYSDIEFARAHRVRQEVPGSTPSDNTTKFMKYAEFKLRDERLLKDLDARLAAERTRKGPVEGGLIKRRSKSGHYPVHISSDGFVRIEWYVTPSLKKFMADISGYVAVRDAVGSGKDFRNLQDVSVAEQESALIELIASGDRMAALSAVKQLYGYKTTRAVQFVNELEGKKSGSHR